VNVKSKNMRLTETERESIRKIIFDLDPHAQVFLFGSRVFDDKKGGDIDLLVISSTITEKNRRPLKLKIYDALGGQKIDLLIARDTSEPFVRIAFEEGKEL
jgi:predicted nucleotidyltransferase